MRKLVLSAGHSVDPKEDRGVSTIVNGRNYVEGLLAAKLVADVAKALNGRGVTPHIDDYNNVLAEAMAALKSVVDSKTLAVEFHFNAANGVATGAEVLVPDGATAYEKQAAEGLASACATALVIKNRGIKPESASARKRLGWMRIACETVLIEVCFQDNPKDMKMFEARYTLLVNQIASVLVDLIR